MSELKEHKFCECDEIIREYRGQLSNEMRPYYLKYEADKVIAELKDKLQAANYQIENLINNASSIMLSQDRVNDDKCAELRHSNYKRCLAMAEMCEARYDEEDAKVNGCGASWEYISNKMKYWERWRWRWDALAEKFKEAK